MINNSTFSGSYLPSDVTFLLDIITPDSIDSTDPEQKEQLIQTGKRHYSDMLTLEQPPTATHEALYYQALEQGKQRMANDIAALASTLYAIFATKVDKDKPLILVSLVRAGVPVGVLLQRAFSDDTAYSLPSCHYGVSIIRDRGLDPVALRQILVNHPNSPLVFVDGWTGKGAIYGELQRSLSQVSPEHRPQIFHQAYKKGDMVIPLVTLADPAGVAWLSASNDDWLMPASLLNSTVSGLISRTLYRESSADCKQGLHQAVLYDNLKNHDKSLEFIQVIDDLRQRVVTPPNLTPRLTPTFATQAVIADLTKRFDIDNINRIKPTIAEATRAILRRDPDCVLINDGHNPQDTVLLRHLCQQKNIALIDDPAITPYQAVTLIKKRHASS